jgi:hypothetical protein
LHPATEPAGPTQAPPAIPLRQEQSPTNKVQRTKNQTSLPVARIDGT